MSGSVSSEDDGPPGTRKSTEKADETTRNGGVFVLSDVGSVGFRSQTKESVASKLIRLPDDKSNWLENVSGECTQNTEWG